MKVGTLVMEAGGGPRGREVRKLEEKAREGGGGRSLWAWVGIESEGQVRC